jgi:AcrR family transcriptional regulator
VAAVPEKVPARRRDAERNREAILAAARDAFAEGGVAAGVDQIARRAGVGPATLYRHFPSKAALVDAVLEDRAGAVAEVVRGAAEVEDPAEAVRVLVHRVVDDQMRDRSFRDLFGWYDAESIPQVPALAELGELIGGIVERARAAGALREDAAVEDLFLLLIAFDCVSATAGELGPAAMHRVADVVVDGLLGEARPLTGAPLDGPDLGRVAAAGRVLPPRPGAS